jgi:hypothetical protein
MSRLARARGRSRAAVAVAVAVALAVALVALVALAPAARADRYEASLGLGAQLAAARVGEPGATARWTGAVGLGARASYATDNRWAYDLELATVVTEPVTYADLARTANGRPARGAATRRTVAASLTFGGELRLGPRFIPTVRLGLGPQLRHRSASDLGALTGAIPAELTVDVAVSLRLGVDLRLGRHRVVGLGLHFERAQPLAGAAPIDIVGLHLRLDHYGYPRWQAPAW